MSTILYSMAGEGRGHATRVRSLIEELRKDNEIILYAPQQAYELLKPIYEKSDIKIRKIPGLCWIYNYNKKLNYIKSGFNAINYLRELPELVTRLCRDIETDKPDLIITDFDPALPRAAKQAGVPFISFDHQHFLLSYDMHCLPLNLRTKAAFMAPAVKLFFNGQQETVVSSFYFPPLKKRYKHYKQIGVLINKEITDISPEHGGHLLVYFRRFASSGMIHSLIDCGYPVKIYGLGKQPARHNIKFYDIDFFRFIEDLAGAQALITTAGNQVVGEALYLGKPVLAIPEPGNFEQEINGYFLKDSGAGEAISMQNLTSDAVKKFINLNEYYRLKINTKKIYGNRDAVRIINNNLNSRNKIKAAAPGLRNPEQVRVAS